MARGPKQPARKPGVTRRKITTKAGPKGSLRKTSGGGSSSSTGKK